MRNCDGSCDFGDCNCPTVWHLLEYIDGDGCTYTSHYFVGVYDKKCKAETAMLKHHEAVSKDEEFFECEYFISEVELNKTYIDQ